MTQVNNPLHGIKLETIVTDLVERYGWEELGERIQIRCFTHDPSIKSSLRFLRKTDWAREKVEYLYLKANKLPLPPPKNETATTPKKTIKIHSANQGQSTKTPTQDKNRSSSADNINSHIWGKKD
ncbi:VF530 family protein [Shewanella profunda]|uniref:VF530 family protein n=1 Tax=Shewanella profunda TaxID=254793 RepID=UPI00200EAC7B|nr:VF530 family protein [Shewanella profunda]MCL1089495.1 VF530 family protein [Shewanella profunda]